MVGIIGCESGQSETRLAEKDPHLTLQSKN